MGLSQMQSKESLHRDILLCYSVLSDQIRELNKQVDQLEVHLW